MSYELNDNELMNFIECVQLLNSLIENGYLNEDQSKKGNLIIYHGKNEERGYMEEGWYSLPMSEVASELRWDGDGQKYLRNILDENSISLSFEEDRISSSCNEDGDILDETEIL